MKFRYSISAEDYQEAQKLIRGRLSIPLLQASLKWGSRVIFVVVAFFLVYAELTNMPGVSNLRSNVAPFLILSAIYIAGFPILFRILAARAYRRDPALHREISVDANEVCYEAEDGAGAKTSMTWNYYNRFVEGKRVFVLFRPSRICTIISKSGMNAEDVSELRALLTRCIVRR